ncbi:MAG: transposase [Acidimicrobiales bacterium]
MAKCERKTRNEVPVPPSLAALLSEFRSCFSAWTFPVFCALACGLLAQSARRTVCGMLVGAQLSKTWSHHRAHRFFSHSRWSVEAVSAILAALVVRLLVAGDAAVAVAIDDTLFHRRGPLVHAASWFHDGSAQGQKKGSSGIDVGPDSGLNRASTRQDKTDPLLGRCSRSVPVSPAP